jgi:hypothetical protein
LSLSTVSRSNRRKKSTRRRMMEAHCERKTCQQQPARTRPHPSSPARRLPRPTPHRGAGLTSTRGGAAGFRRPQRARKRACRGDSGPTCCWSSAGARVEQAVCGIKTNPFLYCIGPYCCSVA